MNNVRINYKDINKKELNNAMVNMMEVTGAQTLDDINQISKIFQKFAVERLLNAEMEEHLGYDKNKRRPEGSDNYRNGTYSKIVKSSSGEINLEIPRDRKGEFSPQIVKKGVRDISNIEDKIIYLYTQGLSTRDISETVKELYDISVSSETVSNITERINEDIKEWQSRPLNPVYPVIFMDGIVCKVKLEGKVQRCTVYVCLGIDCEGKKEVLSVTRGETESSKFWLKVLNDLKSKGVQDVFIFCTDNLPGMTEAIKSCYPEADHQKCIVHQVRNSLKYVPYKEMKEVCKDLKSIYQAPSAEIGYSNLEEFAKKWDSKYAYISKSWFNNWEELSSFWKYPTDIRRLIYTTNPIESFNRSMRKALKTKSSLPSEEALLKVFFIAINKLEKKWTVKTKDWGLIYSQLQILFGERLKKFGL